MWFLIGIGFNLQLIPFDFTVADRWFYFPLVGILGIIGIATEEVEKHVTKYKKVLIAVVIAIIVMLSIRTIARNADWQNGISLYSANLQFEKDDVIENGLHLHNLQQLDPRLYFPTLERHMQ